MSFTDGPYELNGYGVIHDREGRALAQVGSLGTDPEDVEEGVSNGFLFEAAPDLYEALDAVRAMCEDPDNRFSLATARLLDDIRNEVAMPALARALGKETPRG